MSRLFLGLLVALLPLATACGGASDPSAPIGQVLLVGIESLSLEQVDAMLDRGELPNFARLQSDGARGRVLSPDPLLPPVLWSTALTGQSIAKHQMTAEYVEFGGGIVLAPSSMRVVPTIFQIGGQARQLVASIGFPGTWPVEVLNGLNLTYGAVPSRMTEAAEHSYRRTPGQAVAFPTTLYRRALDHYTPVDGLDRSETAPFFTFNETEFTMLYDLPLGSIYKHENPPRDWGLTLQRDRAHVALTVDLLEEFPLRLAGVHLELPESVQPAWWRAEWPDHYAISTDARRRFRNTMDETYRRLDTWLGELMAAAGDDAVICVVGDRGFGNTTDPMAPPSENPALVPAHLNRSLLFLHGPGIRRGVDLGDVDLLDVAPTVLTLLDLAVGTEMDGAVLERALTPEFLGGHQRPAPREWTTEFGSVHRYPSQLAGDRSEGGQP